MASRISRPTMKESLRDRTSRTPIRRSPRVGCRARQATGRLAVIVRLHEIGSSTTAGGGTIQKTRGCWGTVYEEVPDSTGDCSIAAGLQTPPTRPGARQGRRSPNGAGVETLVVEVARSGDLDHNPGRDPEESGSYSPSRFLAPGRPCQRGVHERDGPGRAIKSAGPRVPAGRRGSVFRPTHNHDQNRGRIPGTDASAPARCPCHRPRSPRRV